MAAAVAMPASSKIVVVNINPGKKGGRKVAIQAEPHHNFNDIYLKAVNLSSLKIDPVETTKTIKKFEQPKHDVSEGIIVQNEMNVMNMSNEFNCRYIDIFVDENNNNNETTDHNATNAFAILMQKNIVLPEKPKGKLTAPQHMYVDLLDLARDIGCGWTSDLVSSGQKTLKKLSDALWYIDHAHTRFRENGCKIPEIFERFQNYNQFAKYHHTPPQIKTVRLTEICGDLADIVGMPSLSSERNKVLKTHIESLNAVLIKYNERLMKQSLKKKQDGENFNPDIAGSLSDKEKLRTDTSCEFIPAGKLDDNYASLDEFISRTEEYEYVNLDEFTPSNRYKRREYVKKLKLSRPVMLYRVAYGGCVGTLNFIWRVPEVETPDRIQKNSAIINVLTESLPKYSSRQMRRDFIHRYFDFVKCPKSVLRNMFFNISGFEPTYESAEQRVIDERVAEVLLSSDDPKLLLDLRTANGKDTTYDKFYDETAKYFDEQLMHVHERRKGNELYMPLAISVEYLREQVRKRLPEDTPMPSTESLRLQFSPSNTFAKTALKYSAKLNVKFRVQTRLGRVDHQDAHYVAAYYKYLKQFMVTFRDNTVFVCLDDKSIVPVGEPGIEISTGVRGHNKVIVPDNGPKLVATDHDFHVSGIVPSVVLLPNIPERIEDSFFSGKMYVTTKDKIFDASTPFRHASELSRILKEHYMKDETNEFQATVLCLLTDGGPDHRVTYDTVQASLLQLFLVLDLDVLVVLRTAPYHSWMNPAERCMSILNLALQHCALSREEMSEDFEKMMKSKKTLSAVRNQAELFPALKAAYSGSINPIIKTVNNRFERMKLKGEFLTTYTGIAEDQIDLDLDAVRRATGSDDASFTKSSKSKDFKSDALFQSFLKSHSSASHYCFQIRKCLDGNCYHCTQNPVRDKTVFDKLSFLPEPTPMPDTSGGHYLPFDEVYGKPLTTDKFRPSAKSAEFDDAIVEEDKRNRDIIKSEKARDAVKCSECHKPRVIYSASKTTRAQDEFLRRLRDEKEYTCGDPVGEELVVLRAINCVTNVEITYYSTNLSRYCPVVCCYCGSEEKLLDDSDPYIVDLYEKYSKVRPLCKICRNNKREAKTWGRKFCKKH